MSIRDFISRNKLQPADVIVVKKSIGGLLDHYVVYLGYYHGRPLFIANMRSGVSIITEEQVQSEFQSYEPNRIRRFSGTAAERNIAVRRAISQQNRESYDLLVNNCEHFANYVQEGKKWSKQTNVAAGIGLGILFLGLLGALSGDEEEKRKKG